MRLIDTHCHLTFEPLAEDVPAVLERSRQAGVTAWVTVGTSLADSRKAVELAGRHDNLYAAVGIHPHDAREADGSALATLRELVRNDKVVAIGETGLDFHYNFEAARPEASVRQSSGDGKGKWACLSYSTHATRSTRRLRSSIGWKWAWRRTFHQPVVPLTRPGSFSPGAYISFTGVVTFKNAWTAKSPGCGPNGACGPTHGRDGLPVYVAGTCPRSEAERAGPDALYRPLPCGAEGAFHR